MMQQSISASWRHAALVAAIVAALGIAGCGKKAAPAAPAGGETTAAGTEPSATPSAPIETDADLLTKAKTAENERRLYAPAGNNAMEYYLALRQRNPKDESASNALNDMTLYAETAIEQNLKKGDEPGRIEAARIFALVERIDANAPSLPRYRAMMQKEAGDELKLQQDAAKKTQDDLAKKTEADKAAAAAKAAQLAAAGQPATTPATTPTSTPATTGPAQPAHPAPTQASTPPPPPVETPPPPPPTPAPKPAHTGLPDVVSSVQPSYPRDALRDGVSGEVTVSFTVNPDGSVSGASVVSANPRHVFDSAALEAIRKWRFEASGEAVTGKRTFAFNPGN